ncbi:hypothetical protein MTR67_022940 [Solanum verrucosum]|uniref:Integrase catalytic domain-containing protein n=1 Tax=Solanum verrucosum TaxID=315347 RepID=A0AAF0QVJ6_SOLVR|nr:hypothetical protein MTR67_022940 [Solanum verrucosum]
MGLPHTRKKHDSIWVRVDRVTKSAHFFAVKTTDSVEDYAKVYINEIVKFHGVPSSVIIDRGPQFTSHCWKSFQKGLGTLVNLSIVFHRLTDGYHSNFQMAPYEALYGHRCRYLIGWFEVGEAAFMGH